MKRYFITGTNTDCGKTYVTCQLLDYLTQQGNICQAIKPVASGGSADIDCLQKYNSFPNRPINRWQFTPSIAPHIAAKQAGVRLSAAVIADFCQQQPEQLDYLLIEGAGGLMVPLNEEETWLDLLKLLDIPVILVVGMTLGCINHALLTAFALKTHKIPCAGWIANEVDSEMLEQKENSATLSAKMPMPLITTITNCGKIEKSFCIPF